MQQLRKYTYKHIRLVLLLILGSFLISAASFMVRTEENGAFSVAGIVISEGEQKSFQDNLGLNGACFDCQVLSYFGFPVPFYALGSLYGSFSTFPESVMSFTVNSLFWFIILLIIYLPLRLTRHILKR